VIHSINHGLILRHIQDMRRLYSKNEKSYPGI